MERRLAGIVVVLLALCAVVVVPALDGRRVAGSAVALSFPDPPKVGDCLREPFPLTGVQSGSPAEISVTSVNLGACDTSTSGEVVVFWETRADAEQAAPSRFGGPCYRQAAEYAGLQSGASTDLPGAPTAGPVRWKPTIGFTPYLVVPGELERRAGRTWVACLVVPVGGVAYSGTLRDAVQRGLPAQYGLCFDSANFDLLPKVLLCDQPHAAELLATGWIPDRSQVSFDDIGKACQRIAGRLIGSADPTKDQALRIVAGRLTLQSDGRPDGPLTISCSVTGAGLEQLAGSVIGLGERPVPVAG